MSKVTVTSLLKRMQEYDQKIWEAQHQILHELGLKPTDYNMVLIAELAFQDPPASQREIDEFVAKQRRISHKDAKK